MDEWNKLKTEHTLISTWKLNGKLIPHALIINPNLKTIYNNTKIYSQIDNIQTPQQRIEYIFKYSDIIIDGKMFFGHDCENKDFYIEELRKYLRPYELKLKIRNL